MRDGEQITVTAVGESEKYKKLREVVKQTNKKKPNPDHIAALRRLFNEEPELWRATGNMAKRTISAVPTTNSPPKCKSAFYAE